LRRLPRTRSSQRRRKWLNFLSHVAMNQATGSIIVINIATTIKVTNVTATITNPTVIIKTINQRHNHFQHEDKDSKTKSTKSYDKKDDCKCNHSKKKSNKAMHNDLSSLLSTGNLFKEGVVLFQDLICALVISHALVQVEGARTTTMWPKMTAGQVRPSSMGACNPLRVMTADTSIGLTRAIPFLPPSPLQRQRKVSAPRNKESHQ
jgi:hypothetical protein